MIILIIMMMFIIIITSLLLHYHRYYCPLRGPPRKGRRARWRASRAGTYYILLYHTVLCYTVVYSTMS